MGLNRRYDLRIKHVHRARVSVVVRCAKGTKYSRVVAGRAIAPAEAVGLLAGRHLDVGVEREILMKCRRSRLCCARNEEVWKARRDLGRAGACHGLADERRYTSTLEEHGTPRRPGREV